MIIVSSKVKRTELATHHKIVMESGGLYEKLDDEHVYVRVSFDDPEQYRRYVELMKFYKKE
jgi:hypothetical protein